MSWFKVLHSHLALGSSVSNEKTTAGVQKTLQLNEKHTAEMFWPSEHEDWIQLCLCSSDFFWSCTSLPKHAAMLLTLNPKIRWWTHEFCLEFTALMWHDFLVGLCFCLLIGAAEHVEDEDHVTYLDWSLTLAQCSSEDYITWDYSLIPPVFAADYVAGTRHWTSFDTSATCGKV